MAQPETVPALTAMAVSLAADAGAADAVTQLEDAGIPCLLLKGASLAEWLYATDIRSYKDADLMVSPDNHKAAEAALSRAGYTLGLRNLHASVWHAPEGPITVDLHQRLWAVGASPHQVWRVLWGRSLAQSIGGREIRVLDPTARALVVALHFAHHEQLDQPRFRTRDDFERTLDLLDEADWADVDELAHELRATIHLASGLRLLRDDRAVAVADRLKLPDERILATVIQPDSTVALVGALVNIRVARGPRRKLSALRNEIIPPADELRDRSALARRGTAGLAVAYVLAPFMSLRHLPMALSHLRGVVGRHD